MGSSHTRVLLVCGALSGFAALIYQLLWTYEAHLIVGVSAYAVATVLAVFFLGMGVGSYVGGRVCSEVTSLHGTFRIYARIELLIALFALLVPWLFALSTPLFSFFYDFAFFGIVRIVGIMLILVIPAGLIGATFPFLVKLYTGIEARSFNEGFSRVYAVTTLGGVFGVLFAGFVSLKYLGVTPTLFIAVCANVLVAYTVWVLSKQIKDSSIEEKQSPASSRHSILLVGFFALSGGIALGYEVIWTRIFSLYYFGTIYALSVMLGMALLGIAFGSYLAHRATFLHTRPFYYFGIAQMSLVFFSLVGLWTVSFFEPWLAQGFFASFPLLIGTALILLFIPSMLFGVSFTVLGIPLARSERGGAGRAFSVNTFGGLAGSLLTGFILVPLLGIVGASVTLCILGMLLAGASIKKAQQNTRLVPLLFGVLCIGIVISGMYIPSAFLGLREGIDIVYEEFGPTGVVTVAQGETGERAGVVFNRLFVDNQIVAADTPVLSLDSKILAHLPLLLHPAPRSAATIGFGSGGTSYSMLLHPSIQRVDAIELEPRVLEASKYFETLNYGLLNQNDPRFSIILDDARSYFTLSDETYDVIVTDVTNLKYKRSASLYTQEYFMLLKDHVSSGGIVAAWVPVSDITEDEQKTLMNTFRSVFPEMYVWYPYQKLSHFFVYIGTDKPLSLSYPALAARLDQEGLSRDAELVDITIQTLLSGMLLDTTQVNVYLGEHTEVHTDDFPILSFPDYAHTSRAFGKNLNGITLHATTSIPYLTGVSESALGALLYEQNAVRAPLLDGHVALAQGNEQEAAIAYKTAIENSGYLEIIDVG